MKNPAWTFVLVCAGLCAGLPALGQAAPAATGPAIYRLFSLPTVGGSLSYSLTASERLTFGYTGLNGGDSATDLSGQFAYLSASEARPFSVVYSGGYLASTSQQPSAFFHHLTLAQIVNTKHWIYSVSDDLSYLPETGTTGRSGLAGVGDAGALFADTSQGVLTSYATRVDNRASGSVSRKLTGSTQVNGSANYGVDRFLNAPTALQSNDQDYYGGVTHRLNARSSLDVTYSYARFTYLGYTGHFTTQGLSAQFVRQLTRKVKMDIAVGPQRIDSFSLTGTPPSLSYTADLTLYYTGQQFTSSANYTRATNSGSGVTLGATTDTVRATGGRPLTRVTLLSGSLGYAHTASLTRSTLSPFTTQSLVASAQVNRVIRTNLSAYVSYSLQRQSTTGTDLTGLSLSGISHILGFGVTYSPRQLRLGGN